jgi:hypothetical protein
MRRALLWMILASSPLLNGIAAAQPLNFMTFTSNTTWVVPPGVTRVILHGCGGGGGGGGGGGNARIIGSTYNDYAGGSGGAGGEGSPLVSFVQTVTAGSNIVITIGVGGDLRLITNSYLVGPAPAGQRASSPLRMRST